MDGVNRKTYLEDAVPRFLRLLQGTDVRELELTEGDTRLRLHRSEVSGIELPPDAGPELEPAVPAEPPTVLVRSTLVGTFYRAGKPGMAPLVSEGSHVEESTHIGIIEALQVLTDVEAGCVGVVTAVLATDGQPVEYNQPLLEVLLDG